MVITMRERIEQLKKEKDIVILAHYYVDGEVQEIADLVGDSYFLAKKATEVSQQNILFCGVSFMGESAKILNPGKRVIMADEFADCPMAHMVDIAKIQQVREQYPDVAVVCYVNSTAELKAHSDVCVTSSNALKIVKALPNKDIYFIPDYNLAHFIAEQVPEKHFIFNDGFCHVHKSIHAEDVKKAKELHPEAVVLAHPECTGIVLDHFIFDNSIKRRVCIITEKEEALRQFILHDLHSGATMYEAIGAYNLEKHNEIITIVDKSEYQKLMNFINREDPKAFVTIYNVSSMQYQPKI